MRRGLLVAVVVAGVFAASASSTIVVQRGIARVSIGMSKAKVRHVLGAPKKVVHLQNAVGPFIEYRYTGLTIDFQGKGPLSNISTTRKKERTASGIGIGSTENQVKQKVRGVACSGAVCKVGKSRPGKIVTTFYIQKGKVILIAIGRVLD